MEKEIIKADGKGAGIGMAGWGLTGGSTLGPWGAVGGLVAGAVFGGVIASMEEAGEEEGCDCECHDE